MRHVPDVSRYVRFGARPPTTRTTAASGGRERGARVSRTSVAVPASRSVVSRRANSIRCYPITCRSLAARELGARRAAHAARLVAVERGELRHLRRALLLRLLLERRVRRALHRALDAVEAVRRRRRRRCRRAARVLRAVRDAHAAGLVAR